MRLSSVKVIVAASEEVAAQFLRTQDAIFSDRPPNSSAEHVGEVQCQGLRAVVAEAQPAQGRREDEAVALEVRRDHRRAPPGGGIRRVFEEEGSDAGEFKEMVVDLMRLVRKFNVRDFVLWLRRLDLQRVVATMKRLHRRFDVFLDRIIAEHRWEHAAGRGNNCSSNSFG